MDKQLILRQALNLSLERGNVKEEIPYGGGVDYKQTVILLTVVKEDVLESDAVAVVVREVFAMLDVALVVVEVAVVAL